jgi:hypothetical protein
MSDIAWTENGTGERPEKGLRLTDWVLLSIFVFGIYTGYSIQITPTVPFPSVLSGLSGLVLLFRRRDRITPGHLAGLALVMAVLLVSIFLPPDFTYLAKRFTGLVQMTYSLVIGYALFLTMLEARREQLALFFFVLCIVIFIGCLLEDYGGLRPISDAVRAKFYSDFVYDADLRDELLYGRVRPKLFTSEPSAVTFGYTLFSFIWLMTSRWRLKVLIYIALFGLGVVIMPGPTLLLMLLMLAPYQFLAGKAWTPTAVRFALLGVFGGVLVFGVLFLGSSVFSARVNQLAEGADASSFYRVQGPALVAMDVMEKHPVAGIGLTSEAYISDDVLNVYRSSKDFDPAWQFDNTFEVLTNYFWLHWIYFGVVFGTIVLLALSFWFRAIGIPSLWFCWTVWAILGQASGAYVGPKTWAVIFMAGAAAIIAQRRAVEAMAEEQTWVPQESVWRPLPGPSAAE